MSSFRKTLPAGTYYIGDPSHVMYGDDYDVFLKEMFSKRSGEVEGYFPMPGQKVGIVIKSTGDGAWTDNEGYQYGVDAGILGMTPQALSKEQSHKKRERHSLGRWVNLSQPVTFISSPGKIQVKSDKIDILIPLISRYSSDDDSGDDSDEARKPSAKPNRKSPSISATQCVVGQRKRGNDGAFWVVQATKTGIHRWIRA